MSARGPTSLDLLVLALLAERPMSGYDVLWQFRETPLTRFRPSAGSIYPSLKRIRRLGLATAEVDRSTPLRPREIYRLTDAGAARVREWLFGPVTREDVAHHPDELTARFAFMGSVGTRAEACAFLTEYAERMREYQRELIAFHDERGAVMGEHWRLGLELGIDRYGANADWADRARAALSQRVNAEVQAEPGGKRCRG